MRIKRSPHAVAVLLGLGLAAGFIFSASADVIVSDGFESGDFSAWTNVFGLPTVVSGVSHHGSYSAFCNSSGIHTVYFGPDGGEGWGPHIFARAYFKYDYSVVDWDNRGSVYISNWNGSDDMMAIGGLAHWTGADYIWTLGCLDGSSWNYVTSSSAFALNTSKWYCMEVEIYVADSGGFAKLYVDGAHVLSIEGIDNDGQGNPNHGGFGQIVGTQDGEAMWWDCCVIADSYIGLETPTPTPPPTATPTPTHTSTPSTPTPPPSPTTSPNSSPTPSPTTAPTQSPEPEPEPRIVKIPVEYVLFAAGIVTALTAIAAFLLWKKKK